MPDKNAGQSQANFKRFFVRGVATLLPTVLTIVVLVKCFEFVQENISKPITEGAIRARRHIHMNQREADALGVKDGQVVKLHIPGECGVTFENVLVYVREGLRLEVHLDTDEGNVADIRNHPDVEIITD